MKLEIVMVLSKGNLDKETIVLQAKDDVDVGDYAVLQTGVSNGGVNTRIFQSYWFPYETVSAEDYVLLKTRIGKQFNYKLKKHKGTAHVFFWGLDEAIWEDDDRALVLLHAPEWKSSLVKEMETA